MLIRSAVECCRAKQKKSVVERAPLKLLRAQFGVVQRAHGVE